MALKAFDLTGKIAGSTDTDARRTRSGRATLGAAITGLAVFVLLSGLLQLAPPHYSLRSQAISDLAVGPYGGVMALGLFLSGLSILAFVAGVVMTTPVGRRPWAGLVPLSIWGFAGVAIAFFPTDIVDAHGYPGTSLAFAHSTTTHGRTHLTIAAVSFCAMVLGLIGATVGLGRDLRLRSVRWPMRLLALAALVGFFLIDPVGVRGYFGLIERTVSLLGIAWVVLVASRLRAWPAATLPRRLLGQRG